jgi:protoporphyrinogen oxidase
VTVRTALILGGGPTALATAYRLAEHGVSVQVIERLPWAGGLCRTFEHGDALLDIGPHRFTPHTEEVLQFVQELCGEELMNVPEHIKFFLFNRLVTYPFKMLELLRTAPPWLAFFWGGSWVFDSILARIRALLGKDTQTYEQWAYARFGRGVTNSVLRPIAEKTWGVSLDELSWRLARQRIAFNSLGEVLLQILTGRRRNVFETSLYPQGTFLYPRRGYGTITDGMTERIRDWGGQIILSGDVTRIVINNGCVEEVVYVQDGQEKTVSADYVVSTIPINLLSSMLIDSKNQEKLQEIRPAADSLRFRKLILIYFVLDRDEVYDAGVAFFPGKKYKFGRTWQQHRFSDEMTPTGKCVLGVEITCWEEDEIWEADLDGAVAMILPQLEEVNLVQQSEVLDYFWVRIGYAYPVWDVNYRDNLETVQNYLMTVDNLVSNGRPGYFSYNNLHHSLEMGFLAANHILDGGDKEDWREITRAFDEYRLIE